MHPGPGTNKHLETKLAAQCHEAAQIAILCPDELPFVLLMMIPENVGRDDVDARRLHFQEFFSPVSIGDTAVVKFTHHGQPRFSVECEILAVDADRASARRDAGSEMQVPRLQSRWRLSRVDGEYRRGIGKGSAGKKKNAKRQCSNSSGVHGFISPGHFLLPILSARHCRRDTSELSYK